MNLPPGQYAVPGFPRFGTHLHKPPPLVPANARIEIAGAVGEAAAVPLNDLTDLPRRELTADLHCVAGWSATGLRWEGVPFEAFYRAKIAPSLLPGKRISHVGFTGLDGYHWTSRVEDVLDESVLIADRLGGRPLDSDHGAPARLVSPHQYGYVNVKHLCRIEVFTEAPADGYGTRWRLVDVSLRSLLINPHPRARVWKEERHRFLPGLLLRPIYRLLVPPIRFLSARGAEGRDQAEAGHRSR